MRAQRVEARAAATGWNGVVIYSDGSERTVLDERGEPDVFSHPVEAIAVAGLVASRGGAAHA